MRAALLLLAVLSAAAQTFPVAGVVVDATSGAPMKRVRVTMTSRGRDAGESAVITGQDGKFSFQAPKGKFGLMAEYRGSRQPYGQQGPGLGFNVAIFTGPDQVTSNLVFKWYAPGAITGRVTDESNEPVENALVQLIRARITAGRKLRVTVAWAHTDDRGQYRFGQCAGGTYFLAVTGEPWYSKLEERFVLARAKDAQPTRSFAPVYYPNALEPGGAQPIELAPGAEINADFRLTAVTGVNVHIHCEHPPEQKIQASLVNDGIEGVTAFQYQKWLAGDDTTIAGVLPGRYQLRVEGRNGSTAMAWRPIEVGNADLNLDVALTTWPSVSGTAIFPGKRPTRTVYVRLVDQSNYTSLSRVLDANGAFNFETVKPGQYRLVLTSADGFFAAAVTVKGAPSQDGLIDIDPGAHVKAEIVASDEMGTVKGVVLDGDKPVPGVLVVLASAKDTGNPGDFHAFQTDSDGSFDFPLVRATDYVLFAADRLDLEYSNRVAVRDYLASGTPVRIAPHASVVQNLSLTAR